MTTKKELRAAEILANKRAAYTKRVRSLIGHVAGRLPMATITAAFDTNRPAEELAAEIAAQEPVGKAVHALKAEAVDYADQKARETVARVRAELEKHAMDRNAAAPYPRGDVWAASYEVEKRRYNLFHAFTRSVEYSGRMGAPDPCVIDDDLVERFVDHARQNAAAQYDAFICKLVAKVGDGVTEASLTGSHVWSYSHLTVTKDGATEVWKTQQIVNQTKYGSPYLQWPTRKLK